MCVGMDVDFNPDDPDYGKKMEEAPARILASKEELGLLLLEKSVRKGYHMVFRRRWLEGLEEGRLLENQEANLQWASDLLGIAFDKGAKDITRVFFTTGNSAEDLLYLDDSLFGRECACGFQGQTAETPSAYPSTPESDPSSPIPQPSTPIPQPSSLIPQPSTPNSQPSSPTLTFKGIPYSDIIAQYWETTGEEHTEGYRNTALYRLAFALRYICDFSEAKIKAVLPTLGLPDKEIEQLVHSACVAPRSGEMPRALKESIETLQQMKLFDEQGSTAEEMPEVEQFADVFTTAEVPELPPIFKEWYEVAPDDFKLAVVLTMLPFLGTVGSRLRAEYFNGEMHSPSFICCVEAPQANGKSFVRRLDNGILGELKRHDAAEREKERVWKEARKAEREARVKYSKQELQEMMMSKPEGLIRYVAPTISITELLKKMVNARGLHVMAVSEEIDTVYKAMRRGFSDFSDLLRKAFDNAEHGQDYASEQSWSGIVQLFFNTVYCGTPKAVRRFFPDVEDGMISRVIFVTFPDQAYKPLPAWKAFSKAQEESLSYHLNRLNMVSLVDGEVQPEHTMNMGFMVKEMKRWCTAQQKMAAEAQDLTRDTFCRRSAVMGFRAAMLAHYLWEEKDTPAMRTKVKQFGVWVANCCLRQFLLRFNLQEQKLSTFPYKELYESLPDEFDQKKLVVTANAHNIVSHTSHIIYKWKLADLIESHGRISERTYTKIKTNG